jgi:ABC-type polar amino acid transport system ATPase subunit
MNPKVMLSDELDLGAGSEMVIKEVLDTMVDLATKA